MSKYPDNVVFNYDKKEFDAFSKEYLPLECQKYFKNQLTELQDNYLKIREEYHWTELIYNSDYKFKPDIGSTYHLYKKSEDKNFLSIIEPEKWNAKHIGSFTLLSYGKWVKI